MAQRLPLRLDEEVRLGQNIAAGGELSNTLSLRYKLAANFQLAAAYDLIVSYDNSLFKNLRHRMMVDATYGLPLGHWHLSLRERVKMTVASGNHNAYQAPKAQLALRSRLMLQYKGLSRLEPYAYVELRTALNAYSVSAVYNESDGGWYADDLFTTATGDGGWFVDGRSAYLDRIRSAVGVTWQCGEKSDIDVSIMLDNLSNKKIKASSDGTQLNAYTLERQTVGWLNVNYKFSF